MKENFTELTAHLWRGGAWGYTWIKNGDHKTTLWTPGGKTLTAENADGSNVYFGVHPCAMSKSQNQRAKIDDIVAINCLFADFDSKDFSGDKVKAFAHVQSLTISPSVIIDSGGGYHAYWLLCETFKIEDNAQRERAKKVQANWVKFVCGDPGAKDLAHVLRVPVTLNYCSLAKI